MSRVPSFYSQKEATTRAAQRIYHTNSACFVGQSIPYHDRRQGHEISRNQQRCSQCDRLNREGR
jgi:hypothetical protein